MSVSNWGDLEQRFGAGVKLARRPVAVAFLDSAPAHVAHVRSLVIDVLSREQLRLLGRAAERIMARIVTSAAN